MSKATRQHSRSPTPWPALRPLADDDGETRAILTSAQRLVDRGDVLEAAAAVKRAADGALAREDDKRALRLAAVAAELRASRGIDTPQAGPVSAVVVAAKPASPPRATQASTGPSPTSKASPSASRKSAPPSRRSAPPRAASPTIEVDISWFESEAATPDPAAPDRAAAQAPIVAEAVRVWVGPDGQLTLASLSAAKPAGFVEALLVAAEPGAALASRFARK